MILKWCCFKGIPGKIHIISDFTTHCDPQVKTINEKPSWKITTVNIYVENSAKYHSYD